MALRLSVAPLTSCRLPQQRGGGGDCTHGKILITEFQRAKVLHCEASARKAQPVGLVDSLQLRQRKNVGGEIHKRPP
jgi:hypothetical protein